jgi:FMN-dependent oxidoreductase (nitrilotriacetate monooxygenase family)
MTVGSESSALPVSPRFLNLNVFVRDSGYHEAAWRVGADAPEVVLSPSHYVDIARTAERGVLDSLFLADTPGVAEFRSEYLPGAGFDPIDLLSALSLATEHIGLIATASTTYSYPWDMARRFSTLDFLSRGRAGWNIVTTVEGAVAGNFGDVPHPPRSDRYERADEYVEVVLSLWDAWADDAAPMSKLAGRWGDRNRIRPPRHHGTHFDVDSYLPFPRSPQGHPFLTQAGSSPAGVALAAKYADAVFTPQRDLASAISFRRSVRDQAAAGGRHRQEVLLWPGLSFLLGSTEAEAAALKQELEDASSPEFRWRNFANFAGFDSSVIDPDVPLPAELLESAPRSSFAASLFRMAENREASFRDVAQQFSTLPGGLDFTGTPEGMADLMTQWFRAGAADGFTIMPNMLPSQLDLFVDHVVPILQKRGVARTEYSGRTLREHVGLPHPGGRA